MNTRIHIFFCLIFFVASGHAGMVWSKTQTRIDQFLFGLEGEWLGRAEVTPIGPRPYDIHFKRDSAGQVAGSTGTSSIHYWTFFSEHNRLVIRFLTTFGNNRKPIFLDAVEWTDQTVVFQARDPALLRLKISIPTETLSIDVLHWHKLHVSIRLKRLH